LVYSDPLDPYHLLLLGCAKLELSEFLYENKREIHDKDFFNAILTECESLLLAGAGLQANKTSDTVSEAVLGQAWWKRLHEGLVSQAGKIKEAQSLKKSLSSDSTSSVGAKNAPAAGKELTNYLQCRKNSPFLSNIT
jgi:hypothetical protein